MTNSRAKGARAERDAANYLTGHDWPTKRRLAGNGQAGDLMIEDAPHVVIDVKDRPAPAVHEWLAQLEEEAAGRRCMAVVWKPWSKCPDPGEWLAIVANHPLDWHRGEVTAPRDGLGDDIGTAALRAALGWLDVEHAHHADGSGCPMLLWDSIEHGEFLLMRLSTFADEVLPRWETLAERGAA